MPDAGAEVHVRVQAYREEEHGEAGPGLPFAGSHSAASVDLPFAGLQGLVAGGAQQLSGSPGGTLGTPRALLKRILSRCACGRPCQERQHILDPELTPARKV